MVKIPGLKNPVLWGLLGIAMCATGAFGALIGLVFGKVLIGLAIGAAIPPLWCIIALCFFKAIDIIFRGQWG